MCGSAGMPWIYDDGGRSAARFRGRAGDCAARFTAIAAEIGCCDVRDAPGVAVQRERPRAVPRRSSPRIGVATSAIRRLLAELGSTGMPTMGIGSGCWAHLRGDELAAGRLSADGWR
jgi:hypothetical protein